MAFLLFLTIGFPRPSELNVCDWVLDSKMATIGLPFGMANVGNEKREEREGCTLVHFLQLHKRLDVVNARRLAVVVHGAERHLHQLLLLPLDLHHVLLHRVFHDELQHRYIYRISFCLYFILDLENTAFLQFSHLSYKYFSLLTQTVATVDALLLCGWVPCLKRPQVRAGQDLAFTFHLVSIKFFLPFKEKANDTGKKNTLLPHPTFWIFFFFFFCSDKNTLDS